MPLRWRETWPGENIPDDLVGGLGYQPFARITKYRGGSYDGHYQWALNQLPTPAGVQKFGWKPTIEEAKEECNHHFQEWLKRSALREATPAEDNAYLKAKNGE